MASVGRNSKLADPEFAQLVAELYATGTNTEAMAEELDCHKDTVRRWVRDPRVQVYITRFLRERVNRITRRIDSEMEGRLAHVASWDIQDLLKVRKEYLERLPKETEGTGGSTADTINELSEAMDSNPDLAEALRAIVGD